MYSTCTTNVLENEGVVASILEELGESVELVNVEIEEKSEGISPELCRDRVGSVRTEETAKKVARFRPHVHHTGGFFIAKFRKTGKIAGEKADVEIKIQRRETSEDTTRTEMNLSEIQEHLTTPLPYLSQKEELIFLKTKHTVRLAPKRFQEIKNTIFVQRVGLPIFKVLNDGKLKPLPGLERIYELSKNKL